jgi:3-phosphoshikimate 1-carboxyvinyltransferase
MKIKPARNLTGQVNLPGDKSISHRAAIVAALARGPSVLTNYSTSQDCHSTLECLSRLGVTVAVDENTALVNGKGIGGFIEAGIALDCGNSGSTMRMLAGALAGQNFHSKLTGDSSLRSRPMGRIIEPLEMMGVRVDSNNGKPPLVITPQSELKPIRYKLPVSSAQVKSCVLFAGLHAHGRTTVVEQEQTRDHTERMLKWFEAPIELNQNATGEVEISVASRTDFDCRDTSIPGDISSAAFLIAAAALLPGSSLTIKAVGLNPTRTRFLAELLSVGAHLRIDNVKEICNEPVGDIHVTGGFVHSPERGVKKISGKLIPQLIDELPLLAVVGSQLPGGIEIRDAGELRFKESDRLATTAQNLRAMGAEVDEFADGIAISGPVRLKAAHVDSHGDHRIAMAFSVAALIADGESEIKAPECVAVSFPGFFEALDSLCLR